MGFILLRQDGIKSKKETAIFQSVRADEEQNEGVKFIDRNGLLYEMCSVPVLHF